MHEVSNGKHIKFIWEYGEALKAQRQQAKEVQAHKEQTKEQEIEREK